MKVRSTPSTECQHEARKPGIRLAKWNKHTGETFINNENGDTPEVFQSTQHSKIGDGYAHEDDDVTIEVEHYDV